MKAVTKNGIDLLECFEHFDDNGDGVLDERELRDGMEKLGIELTPTETRGLMDRFQDAEEGGGEEEEEEEKCIQYRDFIKALNLPRREEDTVEAERVLRTELKKLAIRGRERPNFAKLFDEVSPAFTLSCDTRQCTVYSVHCT